MYKLKFIYLIISLVIIVFLFKSCSDSQKNDQSLTLQEYYELGVPSIDSQWRYKELNQAIDVLFSLKKENYFQLPVINSSRSKELFQKLVDRNNSFSPYGIEAETKYLRILFLYENNDFYTRPGYYHHEDIKIKEFQFYKIDSLVNMMRNYIGSPDLNLKKSIDKLSSGYLTFLGGMLSTQNDTINFDKADLLKLSNTMIASINSNLAILENRDLTGLLADLNEVILNNPIIQIRMEYRRIYKKLYELDKAYQNQVKLEV